MRARRVRALRGTAAAAIAVLFASTAHTLSGGGAPPLWLVAAITILAAPLCIALVGRRRSLPGLAVAVAVAQLALHAAFAAVGGAAPLVGYGPHQHALSPFDGALAIAAVDPAAAAMTLGHAAAALVTIVVLAWGERLLAAIAHGIRRLLRPAPPIVPARPTAAPLIASPCREFVAAAFLDCVRRRGPPARCAPALAH